MTQKIPIFPSNPSVELHDGPSSRSGHLRHAIGHAVSGIYLSAHRSLRSEKARCEAPPTFEADALPSAFYLPFEPDS